MADIRLITATRHASLLAHLLHSKTLQQIDHNDWKALTACLAQVANCCAVLAGLVEGWSQSEDLEMRVPQVIFAPNDLLPGMADQLRELLQLAHENEHAEEDNPPQ